MKRTQKSDAPEARVAELQRDCTNLIETLRRAEQTLRKLEAEVRSTQKDIQDTARRNQPARSLRSAAATSGRTGKA